MSNEDQYNPDDNYWKQRFGRVFHSNEMRGDFIEWLFDVDEDLEHTSYSEKWEEFKKYQDKHSSPPPNPSTTNI